jgi:hypothetical protein
MSFDPSKKKNTLFAAIALVGTLFFGDVRFLGSYVAYALSKEREFYKV